VKHGLLCFFDLAGRPGLILLALRRGAGRGLQVRSGLGGGKGIFLSAQTIFHVTLLRAIENPGPHDDSETAIARGARMTATRTSQATRPRKERAGNAAMRRRQIIEATIRSVVKNGLAGTTLATVSAEAGLSQGVAVFYFRNKQTLLAEVLRHQYEIYQAHWRAAREAAGPDPLAQLIAMVRADFDPAVCNADSLVIWHAFWGEANARPLYAEISERFDSERVAAMRETCAALLAALGRSNEDAAALATGIDALTDGLWLRIYLATDAMDAAEALWIAARFLAAAFPEHAATLTAGLGGG
jgi:AcrR family transcriptional regulator